jgi:hypothetical protein
VALVRTDVPLKHRFLQEPHGVISQKVAFFTVTAVKTLNLSFSNLFGIFCIIAFQASLAFVRDGEHSKQELLAKELIKSWNRNIPSAFDSLLRWDIRSMYR